MKTEAEIAADKRSWYLANQDRILANKRIKRAEKICDVCGSAFTPKSRSAKDIRCSPECRATGRKNKAKRNQQSAEVKARKRQLSHEPKHQQYKKKWWAENRGRVLLENFKKHDHLKRICDVCGTEFVVPSSGALRCSPACRILGRVRTSQKRNIADRKSGKSKAYRNTPERKLYTHMRNTINKRLRAMRCR